MQDKEQKEIEYHNYLLSPMNPLNGEVVNQLKQAFQSIRAIGKYIIARWSFYESAVKLRRDTAKASAH